MKKTIITLIILLIISTIVVSFSKNKENEPTANDFQPQRMTLKGVYTECIPTHKKFNLSVCYNGIKTIDGSYYIVDFALMSQTKPDLKDGDDFTASGVFTPMEMLSTDRYKYILAKGIFSITDIDEISTTTKPVVTKPVPTPALGKCFIGGCSGQICSDQSDMASTCEWRQQYACYQKASCERQSNGQCGWTQTSELKACISSSE